MSKRYQITLSNEAAAAVLRLAKWKPDGDISEQKAIQKWIHDVVGIAPPMHGGMRPGGFGRKAQKKKSQKRE